MDLKPSAPVARSRHLRASDLALLWLSLLLWTVTFLVGTLVDSAPYRDALQTLSGGWQTILGNLSVVFVAYTLSNVGILCVLAGTLGALGAKARLGADREPPEDRDTSAPRSSAVLRSFLVYLFLIAGLLILGDDPAAPTQKQYVRIAGFISLLGFSINYRPSLFGRFLSRFGAMLDDGKVVKS
ncbi:MAG: hypothetical protein HC882_05410 [Acidobacteria bacterium]|nr:hypothetical protein [Acidobacteriota bacterium]